jgi:hypothetical protein
VTTPIDCILLSPNATHAPASGRSHAPQILCHISRLERDALIPSAGHRHRIQYTASAILALRAKAERRWQTTYAIIVSAIAVCAVSLVASLLLVLRSPTLSKQAAVLIALIASEVRAVRARPAQATELQ